MSNLHPLSASLARFAAPILTLLLFISLVAPLYAAPLSLGLDTSFGEDGIVYAPQDDRFFASYPSTAIQSDGRIIVAGSFNDQKIALARFNSDGTLDNTFGDGGACLHIYDTGYDGQDTSTLGDLVVQPDGKIIVVGMNWSYDLGIVRLNPDCSRDTTFGVEGVVTTSLDGGHGALTAALQADGKLVVGGHSSTGFNWDLTLLRYDVNGTLDPSFGEAGKVITTFGEGVVPRSLVVQPDGKLVVLVDGIAGLSGFIVARYQGDGTIDTTFGENGVARTTFGGNQGGVGMALVLQPDGNLVAAGYTYERSQLERGFALARYAEDGALDSSFGSGGVITETNSYWMSFDLALQEDGKLVAVGGPNLDTDDSAFRVVRYNSDGSLDSEVTTGFDSEANASASGIAIQEDGRLVVMGAVNSYVALARYREGEAPAVVHLTNLAASRSMESLSFWAFGLLGAGVLWHLYCRR